MSKIRIYLAAGLFILLTGFKILMPEQSAGLCKKVREAVSRDYDYEQAFEELGGRLSDGAVIQALSRLNTRETPGPAGEAVNSWQYKPETVEDMRKKFTAILPDDTVHAPSAEAEAEAAVETNAGTAEETEATDTPEDVPAVVTAFLEIQKDYADYEVPANVSYEIPELPFGYASPVAGYTSSGFGFRVHPILNEVKFHYGTDFAAWSGTDITSFADGTVSMVGWDDGYGNYIMIDHGDGWQTLYAHCSTVYVICGQTVKKGDKIALVGDSGETTGPHLHFELTHDGIYYNPEFLQA